MIVTAPEPIAAPVPQAVVAPSLGGQEPSPVPQMTSLAEADKFIASLTPEQTAKILATGSIDALAEKPVVVDPAPVDPAAEPKPDDKAAEPANEAPPELTADVLDTAHPALKNLYEEHGKVLEELAAVTEQLEKIKTTGNPDDDEDPVIQMRREMRKNGHIDVPVHVDLTADLGINIDKVIDVRGVIKAFNDAEDDESAAAVLTSAVSKLKDLVGVLQKEGNLRIEASSRAVKNLHESIGEARATFRTELEHYVPSIPEAKGAKEPVFVTGPDGRKTINEAHPGIEFVKWVRDSALAGEITDGQIRKYGWDWCYTTWKAATKGIGPHMAEVRSQAIQDRLTAHRAVTAKRLAPMTAGSVGGAGSSANNGQGEQFHGFSLNWLKTGDNALKASATWDAQGNAKAMPELIALLRKGNETP